MPLDTPAGPEAEAGPSSPTNAMTLKDKLKDRVKEWLKNNFAGPLPADHPARRRPHASSPRQRSRSSPTVLTGTPTATTGTETRPSGRSGTTTRPGETPEQARERRRRRRRRRRRSRDSIVGLPLYTEEPLDHEMTLLKRNRSTDSFGRRLDSDDDEREDGVLLDDEALTMSPRSEYGEDDDTSTFPPTPSRLVGTSSVNATPSTSSWHLRNMSERTFSTSNEPPSYFTSRDVARPEIVTVSSAPTVFQRGHRATISSPIAQVPPSLPASTGRPRASTLMNLLSSSRNASSSSVNLLGPPSTARSPYGGTGSVGRQASNSVSSLNISSPLPGSFVQTSYTPPRSGLSPEQMTFISSRENLQVFGRGPGLEPPSFDEQNNVLAASIRTGSAHTGRSRSSSLASVSPSPVGNRSRSASSASALQSQPAASSPLARPSTDFDASSSSPRQTTGASRELDRPLPMDLLPAISLTLPSALDAPLLAGTQFEDLLAQSTCSSTASFVSAAS